MRALEKRTASRARDRCAGGARARAGEARPGGTRRRGAAGTGTRRVVQDGRLRRGGREHRATTRRPRDGRGTRRLARRVRERRGRAFISRRNSELARAPKPGSRGRISGSGARASESRVRRLQRHIRRRGEGPSDAALAESATLERAWILEPDVAYAGAWLDFFKKYDEMFPDHDLIAVNATNSKGGAPWPHTSTCTLCKEGRWYKAFLPVFRMSKTLARAVCGRTPRERDWPPRGVHTHDLRAHTRMPVGLYQRQRRVSVPAGDKGGGGETAAEIWQTVPPAQVRHRVPRRRGIT